MQRATDLQKVAISTSEMKDDIVHLLKTVSDSKIDATRRQSALDSLGQAYIALAKGDERGALIAVQKARSAVQRAVLEKRW